MTDKTAVAIFFLLKQIRLTLVYLLKVHIYRSEGEAKGEAVGYLEALEKQYGLFVAAATEIKSPDPDAGQ